MMIIKYRRLLAKSSKEPLNPLVRETLAGHIHDVINAGQALTPHLDQILSAARLSNAVTAEDLRALLLRAAALHDLGKANTDFQLMVRGSKQPQAFRHEILSGYLATSMPAFRDWFFQGVPENRIVMIVLAVLGHHLRLPGTPADLAANKNSASTEVHLLLSHQDFVELLNGLAHRFCLTPPPDLPDAKLDCLAIGVGPLKELQKWLLHEAVRRVETFSPEDRRLLAVLKALLISLDLAGSAVPKIGECPGVWVTDALAPTLTEEDLAQLVMTRLGGQEPRPFQECVRQAPDLAFVRAGCGSGKTAAAYLWASHHAVGRRLFFCYPTTGTATEGFRDYVHESDLADSAALLHGRAEVDLEDILGINEEADQQAQRLEALQAWTPLLIVCTIDRVLGLIQNNRSGLFSFPAIAKGAFVFDEIHLYDDRLFGALLRFLGDGLPGVPTLLMTASLPAWRLDALREVAAKRKDTLYITDGPPDLEHLLRYRLQEPCAEPDWELIAATLHDSQHNKVLWVANTVGRAMEFREQAVARGLGPVLCYHSRFRFEDRVKRHHDLINAFRRSEPALAISTQVCEVSLDISADLLITDLAPIPSLIQRLGRLNRRAVPGACTARNALFLEVETQLPYNDETFNIQMSQSWVCELAGRDVSQAELAAAFEKRETTKNSRTLRSEWLDGGIHSTDATLREATPSLALILPQDEAACIRPDGKPDRKQLIRKTLTMPPNRIATNWQTWKRIGYTPIAPEGAIDYSPEVGASWSRK